MKATTHALALLVPLVAGCDRLLESQTITLEIFPVEVRVTAPVGTHLGGIPVTFARSDRLTTNPQGRLRVNYQGAAGSRLHIAVELPPNLSPLGPQEREFVLGHDPEGKPAAVHFVVPAAPADGGEAASAADGRAKYVVVVDSDCEGQDVEVDGDFLGTTDVDGYLEKNFMSAPGGIVRIVAKATGQCAEIVCAFVLPEQGAILNVEPSCDASVAGGAPPPLPPTDAVAAADGQAVPAPEPEVQKEVSRPARQPRRRPRRARRARRIVRAEPPGRDAPEEDDRDRPAAGAADDFADFEYEIDDEPDPYDPADTPAEDPPPLASAGLTAPPSAPPPPPPAAAPPAPPVSPDDGLADDPEASVEVEAPPAPVARIEDEPASAPVEPPPLVEADDGALPEGDADAASVAPAPPPPVEPVRPADGRRAVVSCNPPGLDLYVDGQLALRACGRRSRVYLSPGVRKLTMSGPDCAETKPKFIEVARSGRIPPIRVLGQCRSGCLDRIRDQLRSAVRLNEGDLACLERVPPRDAEYLEARLMLAHVYTTQGQTTRAEQVLTEALKTRQGRSDPELRVRLAELLGKRKQLERASREAEAAWRYRMKFRGSRAQRQQWILNTLKLRAGFFEQLFYAQEEDAYYDKAIATYNDLERTATQSRNDAMAGYARAARARVKGQRRRLEGE